MAGLVHPVLVLWVWSISLLLHLDLVTLFQIRCCFSVMGVVYQL